MFVNSYGVRESKITNFKLLSFSEFQWWPFLFYKLCWFLHKFDIKNDKFLIFEDIPFPKYNIFLKVSDEVSKLLNEYKSKWNTSSVLRMTSIVKTTLENRKQRSFCILWNLKWPWNIFKLLKFSKHLKHAQPTLCKNIHWNIIGNISWDHTILH